MSSHRRDRPLNLHAPQRPSESFAEYCAGELEQRRNSGDEFDGDLFAEAVDLVVRKLRTLEEEGRA